MQALVGGRVMRTESMHLTLAFIGDLQRDRIAAVVAALESTAACARFDLACDALGVFAQKRLVWVGPSAASAALEALAAATRSMLRDAAIAFDPKPFVPHVTIVRNTARANGLASLPRMPGEIRWPIRAVSLMESVPAGGLRVYRPRETIALRARPAGSDPL